MVSHEVRIFGYINGFESQLSETFSAFHVGFLPIRKVPVNQPRGQNRFLLQVYADDPPFNNIYKSYLLELIYSWAIS